MSKLVKRLEMDALRRNFEGVKNFVFLQPVKVDADLDYTTRKTLREQNIRLQMVKTSLARRTFDELGIVLDEQFWLGPTIIAWGTESVKDLSKAVDKVVQDANKDKKIGDRYKVKTAIAEGQAVPMDVALKMPTRLEAIGEVLGALLSPAMELAAQLIGPASQVASQIAQIADKKEE